MAKSTAPVPDAPALSTPLGQATDILATVAQARQARDAARPVASTPIQDSSLGRPAGQARGHFSLKRLVISPAENVTTGDGAPQIVDRGRCRELCVPLYMPKPYELPGGYKLVQPFEVVMEAHEDQYASEQARDAVLQSQVDPYAVDDETGAVGPRRVNLGPVDYRKLNQAGGQTWRGAAGLAQTV